MGLFNKFDIERTNYPVLKKYTYLDTATTGAIPQYAYDAICRYLSDRVEYGMDIDFYHLQWEYADILREDIAKMLGAESGKNIAFGQNSSTLFNIFCNGINLTSDDNVIIYDTAFPAMTYQWINIKSRTGITIKIAKTHNGILDINDIFNMADKKTKAITICHVDSSTGYRHDIKKIGDFCRKNNIYFGVDATQSCGAVKIDVKDMNIDFLTTSTYKWLQCVQGVAFAYISPELIKKLSQSNMGWANVSDRINGEPFEMVMSDTACRFENGGLPAPGLYGLSETIRTYNRLGGEEIQNYIFSLSEYLYEKVSQTDNLYIVYPYDKEHISNIVFVGSKNGITDERIKNFGIRIKTSGNDKLRVGIHYYNNKSDIDKLISCLS